MSNSPQQLFLLAACDGDLWSMAIAAYLGADVNGATYPEEETALILAVRHGDVDAVRWLILEGADVNKADRDGMSPLHHAATGNALIWDLLVDAGASDKLENKRGQTAEHLRLGLGQKRVRRMSHGL